MVRVKLGAGPGPAPTRAFMYAGGQDRHFNGRQLGRTSAENWIRNGDFESWYATSRPDAWGFTSGGGSCARNVNRYFGNYCARITKASTDANPDLLWFSLTNRYTLAVLNAMRGPFTFSCWLNTSNADHLRLYFYDGVSYQYSEHHSGSGDWERLWMSFAFDSTATLAEVGIEIAVPDTGTWYGYIDAAMLNYGHVPLPWTENHNDRAPICQDYDEDGTLHKIRGAMRCIPFQVTGTTVGGAATEFITVTLPYACQQIVHVSLNINNYTGNWPRLKIDAYNYTTTTFDILIQGIAMNVQAAEDYVFDGVIWCIGWNDTTQQWI